MIAARVLADHEDQIRLLKIFEAHRAFPDTDRVAKPCATALVTHVRAIRQVVGAELARRPGRTASTAAQNDRAIVGQ